MKHTIKERGERKYYGMIPHLVDDLPLRMGAVRLYLRYKRLVGEAATRPDWVAKQLSANALATHLGYSSKEMVISYRRELVAFGLIVFDGDDSASTTEIADVWERNTKHVETTPDPMIDTPPDSSAWESKREKKRTQKQAKEPTQSGSRENTTGRVFSGENTTPSNSTNSGINSNQEEPFSLSEKRKAPTQKAKQESSVSGEVEITAKHPAIALVHTLMRFYPHKTLWPDLVKVLGEHPDETKAADCYKAWLTRGFNKQAVTPFVDWYRNGIPQYQTPQRRQFTQPQEQASRIGKGLNW